MLTSRVEGIHQDEEGTQRPGGGGRTREILALAQEDGQSMRKARILVLTAGGGRETFLLLLHHLEMFQDYRSGTSADGPVNGRMAPSEVHQAETPRRWTHLCLNFNG